MHYEYFRDAFQGFLCLVVRCGCRIGGGGGNGLDGDVFLINLRERVLVVDGSGLWGMAVGVMEAVGEGELDLQDEEVKLMEILLETSLQQISFSVFHAKIPTISARLQNSIISIIIEKLTFSKSPSF